MTGPVPAVLAVVRRGDHVLLVRRANPPDQGLWGFPGGHIGWAETLFAAAERELREETGLVSTARSVLTALDVIRPGPDATTDRHFVLVAVACEAQAGEPIAASDALEAGWFAIDALTETQAGFSPGTASLARLAVTDGTAASG